MAASIDVSERRRYRLVIMQTSGGGMAVTSPRSGGKEAE
jgi:hypothetical protein